MAANEEELLCRFRESASRDALRDLLIANQDRVYNACFQVLRRAEDAEDAAQEALLKITEGARSARDADAFRGWIYRVSFLIALDLWRRREATRNRELRSAMNRPNSPRLDDRERIALFEAMDGLDDRERSLLLEHYFEKVPLAQLGERRGISAVAIWKRIDRAREKLKKMLLGAGFAAASARVADALEASVPAAAPATLVGEAVLGKILAEGLAVGTTNAPIVAAAGVVLLLGLGIGGWSLFNSGEVANPTSKRAENLAASPENPAPTASPSAIPNAPTVVAGGEGDALRETLQRYKAWVARWKASHTDEFIRSSGNHSGEARKEFKGTRAMILKDPGTFLEFLLDPANEELSDSLIGDLLFQIDDRDGIIVRLPYGEFPGPLMEGIASLLKMGPPPQKKDILFFLVSVDGIPEELNLAVSDLLDPSDSELQYWAAGVLAGQRRPLGTVIESRLMERCVFRGESDTKRFAIQAISRSENPETRAWMIDRLERNREPDLLPALAEASVTVALRGAGDTGVLDRVAALLIASMKGDLLEGHAEQVLVSALRLPTAQATRILQAAQYKGLPPRLVAAISEVLNRIGRGECTPKELQSTFTASLQLK